MIRIKVEGISKRFTVQEKDFLALNDVHFEAQSGEVVGILGRNGAGKSTLLKILSRIMPPTAGRAELHGRVGSLLEVGTGFHPELSGRENIFLSAALLGMKDSEVEKRFDEIVEFSGVERFLDTPVKHYSSGMYMRLAFSVAAHLEPEILLVDEVLAVGDAEFQRKCMSRLETFGSGGQTVLFVSHNMQAVTRLCNRALLIDAGKVILSGPIAEVVPAYLNLGLTHPGERSWPDGPHAPGNRVVRLRKVRVRGQAGETLDSVSVASLFGIEMEYEVAIADRVLFPSITIANEWGVNVLWSTDTRHELHGKPRAVGRYRATVWVPANFMAEGTFTVTAAMTSLAPKQVHFSEAGAVHFQVLDALDGTTARGAYTLHVDGVVRPLLDWDVEFDSQ